MALIQSGTSVVQCPVCSQEMESFEINSHLDHCLGLGGPMTIDCGEEDTGCSGQVEPGCKKARWSPAPGNGTQPGSSRKAAAGSPAMANRKQAERWREAQAPAFALFQKAQRPPILAATSPTGMDVLQNPAAECIAVTSDAPSQPAVIPSEASQQGKLVSLQQLEAKPLAEIMRPRVLEELIGQNKVLGEKTLLRTLLESHEIPSIILWGPPGCGKTSLAHVLANNSRKQNSTRFVSLSAANTTVNNIREEVKQAQNERKLFKRKTIIFFDEIHRFNKTQQDTFLPHVECGTITMIGATTENPSFQINAALLSRCHVIVLEKLSVEAMESILLRALSSLGIRVLGWNKEADSMDGSKESDVRNISIVLDFVERVACLIKDNPAADVFFQHHSTREVPISIEPEAVRSIAYLCDGDARAALNGLHLAIQAKISEAKMQQCNNGQQNTPTRKIVIQEMHIKEGLQRSHLLYDQAGEEHYNCISALHKTMRASDEKSALYWLARMLEGGENPLYVARRLIRFASEDVGIADPLALTQAVSAHQGCHFIGMPECEVILAQCVVYLARAPKSVEIYMAYGAVKESVRNHKGPLPSVPLHLRNAPTKLMKDLGYGKGYKYPANNEMEDGPCSTKE